MAYYTMYHIKFEKIAFAKLEVVWLTLKVFKVLGHIIYVAISDSTSKAVHIHVHVCLS